MAGYDVSSHMIEAARAKAEKLAQPNTRFATLDLDATGCRKSPSSASFVVMNLGTASDVSNLPHVLGEIERVLKPGGRFFLTFYNSDALLYKMGFLPWVASLEAVVNPYTMCLDVKIGDALIPVHAQLYLRGGGAPRAARRAGHRSGDELPGDRRHPARRGAGRREGARLHRPARPRARQGRARAGHGGAYLIVRGRKG